MGITQACQRKNIRLFEFMGRHSCRYARQLAASRWRRYAWLKRAPSDTGAGMDNEGKCVEFFAEYAAFLAKTVTLVVAILVILLAAVAARSKGRRVVGQLQVDKLNDFYKQLRHRLEHAVLDKDQLKAARSEERRV